MKRYINRIYICHWLIILVFCLLVLFMLAMVFDSDEFSQIWPVVTGGGIIAAVCCNAFEYFMSHFGKQ